MICLTYTKIKCERVMGTEDADLTTFIQKRWRHSVNEYGGMCQIAYRCNDSWKARNQNKKGRSTLARVVVRLRMSEVGGRGGGSGEY